MEILGKIFMCSLYIAGILILLTLIISIITVPFRKKTELKMKEEFANIINEAVDEVLEELKEEMQEETPKKKKTTKKKDQEN